MSAGLPSVAVVTAPRRRRLRRTVQLLTGVACLTLVAFGAAAADPPAGDWRTLRACESSGRYDVVATNGHYGAYQFDLATWASVGGTGLPSDAAPAEQDYRALYLYRMRGWQPWECARLRGLAPDGDAASKRVPTRAESRYMAASPVPEPSAEPPWPGVVLEPGDCHPALRAWQLRMNTFGFGFTGTGCYGDRTRRAVLALQAANGIRTSGLLGPRTWRAAWHGTPPHA